MRDAKLIETKEIPITDIEVSSRLRPVSHTAVESLKQSIETVGLHNEIHLRKIKKSGALRLIAGGHRVAAFKALGRSEIPAKIWDCTDEWAELAEIDDNLAHAELSTLELCVFLARRKEVYERAFPQTKAAVGAELAKKRWNAEDSVSVASFVVSTAEKMGASPRNIGRLVAAGQRLEVGEIRDLAKAPKPVTLKDLQEIAKCGDPTERLSIVKALSTGEAKSAKDALAKKKQPGAAVMSPAETAQNKIAEAWARAPKEARKRFVSAHWDELQNLLSDCEAETGDVVQFLAHHREADA